MYILTYILIVMIPSMMLRNEILFLNFRYILKSLNTHYINWNNSIVYFQSHKIFITFIV